MSEAQGGGLIRDQFPPNQRRYGGNSYRVVHLLVIYFCLMLNFTSNVC